MAVADQRAGSCAPNIHPLGDDCGDCRIPVTQATRCSSTHACLDPWLRPQACQLCVPVSRSHTDESVQPHCNLAYALKERSAANAKIRSGKKTAQKLQRFVSSHDPNCHKERQLGCAAFVRLRNASLQQSGGFLKCDDKKCVPCPSCKQEKAGCPKRI